MSSTLFFLVRCPHCIYCCISYINLGFHQKSRECLKDCYTWSCYSLLLPLRIFSLSHSLLAYVWWWRNHMFLLLSSCSFYFMWSLFTKIKIAVKLVCVIRHEVSWDRNFIRDNFDFFDTLIDVEHFSESKLKLKFIF